MVGPSASGSLNGTPTSMMSASSSAMRNAARLTSTEGYPAVRYGISAVRSWARRATHAGASLDSDKVVADRETVALGIRDLDDRATVRAALVLLRQADQRPRRRHRATVRVHRDPHHGSVQLLALGIGRRHEADLERVENDAGPDRVDADQVDERLHQDGVVAALRGLPHLAQHLVRLDRYRLEAPPRGRGIEAVGHRDDAGEDAERAIANGLGIPRQVGLHVVFVRHQDRAVRQLVMRAHGEQGQRAEPWVPLHDPPLLLIESRGLVEDADGDPGLPHVVQQGRHAEVVQLQPSEAELLAQRYREDADIDGVGECVLVVVTDRRETHEGGLVVEDLVDDELDRALDALDAGGTTQPGPG